MSQIAPTPTSIDSQFDSLTHVEEEHDESKLLKRFQRTGSLAPAKRTAKVGHIGSPLLARHMDLDGDGSNEHAPLAALESFGTNCTISTFNDNDNRNHGDDSPGPHEVSPFMRRYHQPPPGKYSVVLETVKPNRATVEPPEEGGFLGMGALIQTFLSRIKEPRVVDEEPQESDPGIVRYRPEGLEKLIKQTKFTRKEIQMMYRGFKQGCPLGIVNLDQFKEIYAQFFPQGDPSQYAAYVFNTFDIDGNGQINFEELVKGLSVLSRGTLEDKLAWVFSLYDIHGDGNLTRNDLDVVVHSIYLMMGTHVNPPISGEAIDSHVESVFQKLDQSGAGKISMEDFMEACLKDETISQSLGSFDTVL